MTSDDRLHYFESYLEGWNDHDPEKVMDQFAEGGTYFDPNVGETIEGEEIGEYISGADQAFPDYSFEEHRVLTSDEENQLILASEWTMHGTHTGPLQGLPPTDNSFALNGVDIVTISDDGITSITGYFNQKDFLKQLGITFPAIIGQLPKLAVGAVKQLRESP